MSIRFAIYGTTLATLGVVLTMIWSGASARGAAEMLTALILELFETVGSYLGPIFGTLFLLNCALAAYAVWLFSVGNQQWGRRLLGEAMENAPFLSILGSTMGLLTAFGAQLDAGFGDVDAMLAAMPRTVSGLVIGLGTTAVFLTQARALGTIDKAIRARWGTDQRAREPFETKEQFTTASGTDHDRPVIDAEWS